MKDIKTTHPSLNDFEIDLRDICCDVDTQILHLRIVNEIIRRTKIKVIEEVQKHTRDVAKIREAIFNNCDKKTRYKLLKELEIE